MRSTISRRRARALVAAALLVAAAAGAGAQPRDDALYRSLGGEPGVVAIADDFVDRLLADPRTEPFFRDAELPKLRRQLAAQFCELAGGPCRREGKDMAAVHAAQDVRRTDFNAVVEVLQRSLDARSIDFTTQNRLLALLAPMHREIVNVH